ncbi:MAG: GNAT family N-acetyltransferase [Gammaproteobacteria bacterium]|nr:MAG: GNAT family N-acetyltransferase [Gammaproteobacteria bacterium]
MQITIEEISKNHDRKQFDCRVAELNNFLKQQARQKTSKNISKTYVACKKDSPHLIIGFYTLTGYSVITPPNHKHYKNYPHPLNAVKLARIAVDHTAQDSGIGEKLLIDAICKTVLVSNQISAIGLFVDPKTPEVISYYEQYGFLTADSQSNSLEMWLPINTCKDVVATILPA